MSAYRGDNVAEGVVVAGAGDGRGGDPQLVRSRIDTAAVRRAWMVDLEREADEPL